MIIEQTPSFLCVAPLALFRLYAKFLCANNRPQVLQKQKTSFRTDSFGIRHSLKFKLTRRLLCGQKRVRLKRMRGKFQAGALGTHTGVKFKLASEGLQKRKRKEDQAQERKAKAQHAARQFT
jgi:hypothetical protein